MIKFGREQKNLHTEFPVVRMINFFDQNLIIVIEKKERERKKNFKIMCVTVI